MLFSSSGALVIIAVEGVSTSSSSSLYDMAFAERPMKLDRHILCIGITAGCPARVQRERKDGHLVLI